MNLTVVTPPSAEPVTLAEAKSWLRVEVTDDDALITGLISAARALVEKETRRAILTTKLRLDLSSVNRDPLFTYPITTPLYPFDDILVLPRAPLQSVESVKFWSNGTQTTWSSGNYRVVTGTPGRLRPVSGITWPTCDYRDDALSITYFAGFGDTIDAVPADVANVVKLAVRLYLAAWYEHREAVVTGTIATELPLSAKAVLSVLDYGAYG